jgi:hypothetical protein
MMMMMMIIIIIRYVWQQFLRFVFDRLPVRFSIDLQAIMT